MILEYKKKDQIGIIQNNLWKRLMKLFKKKKLKKVKCIYNKDEYY